MILLGLVIALFTAGGMASFLRLWFDRPSLKLSSRMCLYLGLLSCIGLLVWHSGTRGTWLPLQDNFDTLVWLGLLITLFVLYMQVTRPIGGLDWFLMPVVIFLLAMAGFFGREHYHKYVAGTWEWVHWVSSFGGLVAFSAAAAAGLMYLIVSRRLRAKRLEGPNFGSLERLEHLTRVAVTLGFALLSIGLVTGAIHLFSAKREVPVSKIVLACLAWIVYAVVLHAPINPVLRGRKTAILSVIGFVLMIGALVAVTAWPGGSH